MTVIARVFIFRVCLGLLLTLLLGSSVKAALTSSSAQQVAVARIEKIVVRGNAVKSPGEDYVKVIRTPNGNAEAGQVGSVLYSQDQLNTGNATVVLAYLGNETRQSQAIIERNSSAIVQRESMFLKLGRIWIKAAGVFAVRTTYWVLGVPGTSFCFSVTNSNTRASRDTARLEVQSGAVDAGLTSNTSTNDARANQTSNRNRAKAGAQKGIQAIRVAGGQGINLVEGQNIPKTTYPLSAERLKEIADWFTRIETARPYEEGAEHPNQALTPELVPLNFGNFLSDSILRIYLSRSDETTWGTDRLGEETLESGAFVTLQLDSTAKLALWNLKVVAAGGVTIEWERLRLDERILVSNRNWQFYAGDKLANWVTRFVTLHNNTPFLIKAVYFTPSYQRQWGRNLIESEIFGRGKSIKIPVRLEETAFEWDLKIVLSDQDRTRDFSDRPRLEWSKMRLEQFFQIDLFYKEGKISAVPR